MCPNPLVKMDIISHQNRHFGQVGPFKRSWFVIVFFNCKYILMCVDTSHQCYMHPPFTLRPWQWMSGHPWCSSQHFCYHYIKCQIPCGTKTITSISFNHVLVLLSTSWHCAHQRWNSHLSWCCHCWSNTSIFTLSISHNLRICYL